MVSMGDWIETTSGNRISRSARLLGKDHIRLKGNVTINELVQLHGQGPLAPDTTVAISMGKYCFIGANTNIRPLELEKQPESNQAVYGLMKIGSYVIIGDNCSIYLGAIGNRVVVESNCVLHNLSIIYDCCIIRSGTHVPPKMVIPPFSEVLGVGDQFSIKLLANGYKKAIEMEAKELQILGTH